MKKLIYLIVLIVPAILRISAQDPRTAQQYKVPAAYHFDYKVVYEISKEDNKPAETANYYFTKSGDYMSMEPPKREKDEEMDFMITVKGGLMITFLEESSQNNSDKNRKVIKVIDMGSMLKGNTENIEAAAKAASKMDKPETENKKQAGTEEFVRTGKTKQVFGYTAEEYSRHFTEVEKGKERSGIMSVWYAKVDFDPEMMFSFGMGNLNNGHSQSKIQTSHRQDLLGLGLAQKNYLLTEIDFSEDGGKSGTAMKVLSIEKTNFNKLTEGYYIENYSGMSMKEMMESELKEK
jgi:hypothetical protein